MDSATVEYRPSVRGLILPLGVLSGAHLALDFVVLCIPVIGLINGKDVVGGLIGNLSEIGPIVAGFIVMVAAQVLVRVWTALRWRIQVTPDEVREVGLIRTKVFPRAGIVKVTQINLLSSMSVRYRLRYDTGRTRVLSGWTLSQADADALGNRLASAT